jgi:hypothetical protein
MQGRSGNLTGASRLSFIVETGPEVLAGSARIRRSKATLNDTGPELFSGAWAVDGTQAAELLIAARRSLWRALTKKQRLGSNLKSLQSASRPATAFRRLVKRDRGTDLITVDSVESTVAISSGTSVLGVDVHLGGRGTAGSRDGFAVIVTAGVACRPKLCAALRLKTFEARPDARCGPVRGKAARGFFLLARRRYQRTTGAWCWWVRSLRSRFGGQATETLLLP